MKELRNERNEQPNWLLNVKESPSVHKFASRKPLFCTAK